MKIDLPDGEWADLYDPAKVPEKKRRPVVRALTALIRERIEHKPPEFDAEDIADEDKAAALVAKLNPALIMATDDLNDALVVALVREWSFDVDVTLDNLLELPTDAYRTLSEACSTKLDALMPQFRAQSGPGQQLLETETDRG